MAKDKSSWGPVWEKIFSSREWGRYPEISVVRFIAENFYNFTHKDRSKIKILDLGCGTGNHVWYLAREGFRVYGIDGSKTAIKFAKKKLGQEGLKAELVVDDIIRLPYRDNFFDAVIDSAAIQHNRLQNIGIIIHEVHRVLKPEGRIFSMLVAKDESLKFGFGQVHFFNKREIYKLFADFSELIINYDQHTRGVNHHIHKSWLVEAKK